MKSSYSLTYGIKRAKNIIPIQSIWEDLDLLEDRLIEISSSSDPYLTEISQYLISAGGKDSDH